MYMKNTFLLLSWLILLSSGILANPIKGMLERIDKGASDKFVVELHKSPNDFFELDQKGDKVVIRGNTYINIATGINWYLKYRNQLVLKVSCRNPPVMERYACLTTQCSSSRLP